MKIVAFAIASLVCATMSLPAYTQPKALIDWNRFLGRNDMVCDTLTTHWEDGLFTGNGLLGAMLYGKDGNSLRLDIGRTDVTDHRGDEMSVLYGKARLPIGYFELKPDGKIIRNTARLCLWNAEAQGTVTTDKGVIRWRCLTLSQSNIILFQTRTVSGGENLHPRFIPDSSVSSRVRYAKDIPPGYKGNPSCKFFKSNGVDVCVQPMLAGGDYTTAWLTKETDGWTTTFISVAIDKANTSLHDAVAEVSATARGNMEELIAVHRKWWHNYYPQSFVSIPDARMESFYWMQQYKLASATRPGKPALDLMGPWFRYTPWPAYWFNLNIQLSYSPLFTANRLSIAESLVQMIDAAAPNLKRNVPEPYRHNAMALGRSAGGDMYRPVKVFTRRDSTATPSELELGNLTWCLFYYWQYYRYSLDDKVKEKLIPLLRQSINYYLDVMYKEPDGKWHLPYTYSPEYPDGITRDCSYDLSLLRWGCHALLQLSPSDSLALQWKDVLENLTAFPQDDNGLRIGRDVAFNQSHRHYSHLLMVYPLYEMNWEQEDNRALIEKSLNHWHSFQGALQGYSFTGGAAMYAMMGKGDKAFWYLNELFNRYIKSNTMYLESGPVIETPLAAVASIQDLLLQSWGGKIRIFPAVPDTWDNVAFQDLRTEGAFLVSAVRQHGETQWVRIRSLKGGTCIVRPNINGAIKTKGTGAQLQLRPVGNGAYELRLEAGEEITLYQNEAALAMKAAPVTQTGRSNYWGVKRRAR